MQSAKPLQRRASGPDLRRLRTIALALLAGHTIDTMLGVEIDDLVHAGWLGYIEARRHARHVSYGYQRARWAMLDELRRWYGVQKTGSGRRGGTWQRPTFVPIPDVTELEASRPGSLKCRDRAIERNIRDVRDAFGRRSSPSIRLTLEQMADVRAFCARHLSPRSAELMIGLLADGESIDLMAERQGRSLAAAMTARSQAIAALRHALAA